MTNHKKWDGKTNKLHFSSHTPVVIAGPCMLESRELGFRVAEFLKKKCEEFNLQLVFKSSYEKANRTSASSPTGPGIEQGLKWLQEIKENFDVPVVTDVHSPSQAKEAGEVVDILQIPAFLCRSIPLLDAAAATNCILQIKKGQWTHAAQMIEVADYVQEKNPKVVLVERGGAYGYNNLSVDFRQIVDMQAFGHVVVFDATHAVQLPGAGEGVSSGLRNMVRPLVKAAVALGVDGVFMEVHENPANALSDAATQIDFTYAEKIFQDISILSQLRYSE